MRGFRPLARLIGIYTLGWLPNGHRYRLFPAPLEVDRYLYGWCWEEPDGSYPFPAPLEVDRELYFHCLKTFISGIQSFRPLSR